MADDEEPPKNVTPITGRRKRPVRPPSAGKPPPKPVIAVIPPKEIPAEERLPDLDVNLPPHLNRRIIACVNMRLAGAPFYEIAQQLEYASPADAKRDYARAIATTHGPEDWDTLRQLEGARAEALFRRSFEMASADFLIDLENPDQRVPNTQKLQWHEQAARDLMNHAIITGAKAPTRVEITPAEQEYDQLVGALLEGQGYLEIEEADVVQIFETPPDDDESPA
jgi:hypothetical protein